jgi:hypothetical protein
VSEDESVLVEVFAHQGRLKGGQFHKVARDALKLITLARSREASRLILAFGEEAAACVIGRSWLAEATDDMERRSPRRGAGRRSSGCAARSADPSGHGQSTAGGTCVMAGAHRMTRCNRRPIAAPDVPNLSQNLKKSNPSAL